MPLITVEGLDGSGKTTLVEALGRELGATVMREPGGVEAAERIRDVVKASALDPHAEALLFAAARAQLVAERLAPALDAGETVLLDRFVDSSLAYQGAGRGLGTEAVAAINAFATRGIRADRTLYLRIAPETAIARAADRGERDHFEDLAFLTRVAAAYDELARDPRWATIDAEQPAEQVLDAALTALQAS